MKFQLIQEALAKIGNGAMVGVGVGTEEAEGNRVVSCLRQLATGEYAGRVAMGFVVQISLSPQVLGYEQEETL